MPRLHSPQTLPSSCLFIIRMQLFSFRSVVSSPAQFALYCHVMWPSCSLFSHCEKLWVNYFVSLDIWTPFQKLLDRYIVYYIDISVKAQPRSFPVFPLSRKAGHCVYTPNNFAHYWARQTITAPVSKTRSVLRAETWTHALNSMVWSHWGQKHTFIDKMYQNGNSKGSVSPCCFADIAWAVVVVVVVVKQVKNMAFIVGHTKKWRCTNPTTKLLSWGGICSACIGYFVF